MARVHTRARIRVRGPRIQRARYSSHGLQREGEPLGAGGEKPALFAAHG